MYSLKEMWFIILKVRGSRKWLMLGRWFKHGRSFDYGCNISYGIIENIKDQIVFFNKLRSRDNCPIGMSIEEWNTEMDRFEFVAKRHLETYYGDLPSHLAIEKEFWRLFTKLIYHFWL